jgi:hypothetical protein
MTESFSLPLFLYPHFLRTTCVASWLFVPWKRYHEKGVQSTSLKKMWVVSWSHFTSCSSENTAFRQTKTAQEHAKKGTEKSHKRLLRRASDSQFWINNRKYIMVCAVCTHVVCASARVWLLPGGWLSSQEAEYIFSGFIPTNKQTNLGYPLSVVNKNSTLKQTSTSQNNIVQGILRECLRARRFWATLLLHTTCVRSWWNWRASCVAAKHKRGKKLTGCSPSA